MEQVLLLHQNPVLLRLLVWVVRVEVGLMVRVAVLLVWVELEVLPERCRVHRRTWAGT